MWGIYWGSVLLFLFPFVGRAYTGLYQESGHPIRWEGPRKIELLANPKNRSGLEDAAVFRAAVRSLQRWKVASLDGVDFDFWQNRRFDAVSSQDGVSRLFFTSNSDRKLDASVIGFTEVWYDPSSGRILESDLILNDEHYRFQTSPQAKGQRISLENILTHELGHAFGLGHSGHLNASMFYRYFRGQSQLHCDDQAAIRAHYEQGGAEIQGRIVDPMGRPVFGAHIQAISLERGQIMASANSDSSGNFSISSLESGFYALVIEPYLFPKNSLQNPFRGINPKVCSGENFSLSFFPEPVFASKKDIEIQVHCGEKMFIGPQGGSSLQTAPRIDPDELYLTGRLPEEGSPLYYDLGRLSGDLDLNAITFSLRSPFQVHLELIDEEQKPVSGLLKMPIFVGRQGEKQFDTSLQLKDLPDGNYWLRVRGRQIPLDGFPSGKDVIEKEPFFVLLGGTHQNLPDPLYPTHPRCHFDENFLPYQSPPVSPLIRDLSQVEFQEVDVTFCGTIQRTGPSSWGGMLSWSLPWFFMLIAARRFRSKGVKELTA